MIDIITLITQFLLAGLGYWIWRLQRRLQRRDELEDKLREDRMRIYFDLVEPFIILLTPKTALQSEPDNHGEQKRSFGSIVLSEKYRWTAFRLTLIGSDGAIKAYNDIFQHLYQAKEDELSGVKMASLLGTLLLEIRKSMGNEATEIDNWDMLEWLLKEAGKMRELEGGLLTRSSASVERGPTRFLRRWARRPPPQPKIE